MNKEKKHTFGPDDATCIVWAVVCSRAPPSIVCGGRATSAPRPTLLSGSEVAIVPPPSRRSCRPTLLSGGDVAVVPRLRRVQRC
jgi:hypothetical protein